MESTFSVTDIKSRITKDSKGFSNYMNVSIQEMDWLVEQAEMVEELKKENEQLKESLKDIKNVSTLDEYEGSNPQSLLRACYEIAEKVVPNGF